MNLFQTFFPLVLLLSVALVLGWLIPWQKRPERFDVAAAIARNREALERSFKALQKTYEQVAAQAIGDALGETVGQVQQQDAALAKKKSRAEVRAKAKAAKVKAEAEERLRRSKAS